MSIARVWSGGAAELTTTGPTIAARMSQACMRMFMDPAPEIVDSPAQG